MEHARGSSQAQSLSRAAAGEGKHDVSGDAVMGEVIKTDRSTEDSSSTAAGSAGLWALQEQVLQEDRVPRWAARGRCFSCAAQRRGDKEIEGFTLDTAAKKVRERSGTSSWDSSKDTRYDTSSGASSSMAKEPSNDKAEDDGELAKVQADIGRLMSIPEEARSFVEHYEG